MVFETSLETVIAICGAVIVLQGMIALGVSTRIASRARNWLLAAHVALFVAALAPLVADRLPFALAACLALGGKLAGIVFGFAAVTETVEAPFPRHLLFGGTATALAVEVVLATMMIDVTTLMVVSSLVNGLVAALLGAWILRVPWRTDQVAALFLALPFALIATAFLGRLAAAAISPSTETYLASTAIVVLALTGAAFTLVFAILHWHERRMGDALERARDAANSANIAKTEFLRALGHELRTPLTAVVGLSELMRQGDEPALDPFRRDAIDRIHAAGTHMSDMIDDLLDIAMIEAGQQALDARPVALAELVDAAVAMVAPGAADRGIAIETGPGVPDAARLARLVPARSERPAPLPAPGADDTASLLDRHVEVDRRRIVQTLINLLSNAVKFSPEGAV
ncbi:MAG: HAMP domain-containing sensor histidine kinase, partial [Pseudomonadota bacterium]